MSLPLGVLDQSPIVSGHAPAEAVAQTVALAALADPAPEILTARVAAATSRIRVGTGGVLLPYYSALKVAEQFRMLEALFPGRIDLGIGRAPGGDRLTAQAVARGPYAFADDFPDQVRDLVGFLDDALPREHAFARVKAMPAGETSPEVWLLGSSDYSGALAAELGLRFAFAHFISARGGDTVMRAYREAFRPSARERSPRALLCVFVICAETGAEAERLATSIDLRRLHMALGIDAPIPSYDEAAAHRYSNRERAYVQAQRERVVLGDPDEVRRRLLALVEQYAADELMLITITGDYESRRRSYELVAQAV